MKKTIGLKRKDLLLVLVLILLFTNTSFAVSLSDISGHKHEESIARLAAKGVITGYPDKTYKADNFLDEDTASSMLFNAFKLLPVYPIDHPGPDKDGNMIEKTHYSTETTSENYTAAMLPASPDAMGTWSEGAANAVLEARLLEADPDNIITGKEFTTAISKAVLGADKKIDFIKEGKEKGILPKDYNPTDKEISRGEAAYLIDYATRNLNIITVMVTSDIHGNVLPSKRGDSPVEVGGSARAGYLYDKMKEINPNTLILDGGDSPYNTDIVDHSKGKASVDLMNAQGYDATVLGNHDFDYGFDNLLSLAKRADYAMLSANTFWKDGRYPDEFKPYIIKELGGLKVGIVGLTDDLSKLMTHYKNTKEIEFRDQWEVGNKTIKKLEKKVDVIILLAHMHSHNNKIPEKIKNIDLTVGGGNHIFGRPILKNNSIIMNPGGLGIVVNQMNLNLIDKEMIGYTFNQIYLSPSVPEKREVRDIVNKYKAELDASMSNVIGKCTVDIAWSSPLVRTQEHQLGNFISDALREFADADIGIMNGGGIRGGLTTGDITVGDVLKILPFDNKVTVLNVTGQTLWDALENGVSGYPETHGRFPQVSGIRYTFDASKPIGERIVSITKSDGSPIKMDAWYKLACNDFMAGGGDGYSMFNVLNPDGGMGSDADAQDPEGCKLEYTTDTYHRNLLMDYIKKKGEIAPEIKGRITILNPQKAE